MTTAFYSPAECRLHDMGPGHPECPQRLDAIADRLRASGVDIALSFRDAPEATPEQIGRAHSAGYFSELRDLLLQVQAEGQPRALDPDTIATPHTLAAVLRGAGAAVAATDAVIDGSAENAFCAIRPPSLQHRQF